jgi:hypothetical protein
MSAYHTFDAAGHGAPVKTHSPDKFLPALGTLAPWQRSGMFEHRQPFRPTTTLTTSTTILTPVPVIQVKAAMEVKADGNYKTLHNRGGRDLTSPPTK